MFYFSATSKRILTKHNRKQVLKLFYQVSDLQADLSTKKIGVHILKKV